MEQPQHILSGEEISGNIDHLIGLRKSNDLVGKVLNQQATFTQETEDLFYFFNGSKQHLLNLIRAPKFRDNHDLRLQELQQALNIDLMTVEDYEQYQSLTRRRPPASIFPSSAFILKDYYSSLETYKGLKGSPDTTILYEGPLKEALQALGRRGRVAIGLPFAVGTATLVYAIISAHPSTMIGIPLGVLLLANSLRLFSLTSVLYIPPSYNALHTKSQRADKFVEKYIFND